MPTPICVWPKPTGGTPRATHHDGQAWHGRPAHVWKKPESCKTYPLTTTTPARPQTLTAGFRFSLRGGAPANPASDFTGAKNPALPGDIGKKLGRSGRGVAGGRWRRTRRQAIHRRALGAATKPEQELVPVRASMSVVSRLGPQGPRRASRLRDCRHFFTDGAAWVRRH